MPKYMDNAPWEFVQVMPGQGISGSYSAYTLDGNTNKYYNAGVSRGMITPYTVGDVVYNEGFQNNSMRKYVATSTTELRQCEKFASKNSIANQAPTLTLSTTNNVVLSAGNCTLKR